MPAVALQPASRFTHAELAEIFNAGYEGYYTPFSVDEAAFRFISTIWDDDLDASRVALVGGEPAGICKLAIRGDRGWIGGLGVSAAHRGKGLGEALMREVIDVAGTRGLRELWLEVLTSNLPAIALYEKLDFATVRDVEVWTLEQRGFRQHDVRSVSREQAQVRIARERRQREPWQRADESVAHYEDVEALESGRGAILFTRSGERVSLLQGVAADEEGASELIEALPAQTSTLHWLNGPEGDPFNAAIGSLGGTNAWTQHEMRLALAGPLSP
jgi:ribosomal-protein-alanine N-acetyltransferase